VFVIVLESAVNPSDPAACRRVVKLQQIEDLIAVPPVAPLLHAAGWALPSAQPSWWRLHSSPPMQRATVVVAAPLVVVEEAWTGPLRRWPSLRPIRVAPLSLRLIRATPSSAHGPAPCRLPDRLLLLFSFSRSVIGFASPSPTAVDSRIIDIGFDNTDFLISFDCVAGVACGVTRTPACAAPPRLHVGSSSPPPIGRLYLRHRLRHRCLRLARRRPDQPIARTTLLRRLSSIARCFAKQEGCRCVASSGSSVAAYRRPRRCIYMLSTLSVRVFRAWSSSSCTSSSPSPSSTAAASSGSLGLVLESLDSPHRFV